MKLPSKKILLLGGILILAYFTTRLISLLSFPIFTDEAIYLRWAQIALQDPVWKFISLTDGKQPLFIWLTALMMKIIHDPLFAGRMVSVFAGFGTLLGTIFSLYVLRRSWRAPIFGAILIIAAPFFLVYDRLALMDSLLAAVASFSLGLTYLLVKTKRLDVAMILGIIVGIGLLTKSSALFFVYLLPFAFVLLEKHNFNRRTFFWVAFLLLISGIFAFAIYNILRLSPFFYMVGLKDHTFIWTFVEAAHLRFRDVYWNFYSLSQWLIAYLTWPVFLAFVGGFFYLLVKNFRQTLWLFLYFWLPFFALAIFGKVIYPRFVLFMSLPIFYILAIFLEEISFKIKPKIFIPVFSAILILPVWHSFIILARPIDSPLADQDRGQLLDNWPSGYGINETLVFFQEQAKEHQITIITEGTFGLFPAVYEMYLGTNKNIEVIGLWPIEKFFQDKNLSSYREKETYIVFKEEQNPPTYWPIKKLLEFRRGLGNTYLRVYQLEKK